MGNRNIEISVVVATIGRAEQLERSLEAFGDLDPGTPSFEVIVVLDGENRASQAVCSRVRDFPVEVLGQERAGSGPARNLGAEAARGELVVLLNDDTRPDPGCLLVHSAAQSDLGPCVTVGRVEWDPKLECTPYMAWLAPNGHQFNYGRLEPFEPIPWDACWGTNLAIPRSWLLEVPFDPQYPCPAVEDGEWGYRLVRAGRQLRYVPGAVCYHDHRYDGPADYRQRARAAGAASRYVARRHPELAWALIGRPIGAAAIRIASMVWPGSWRRHMVWDVDFRSNYVLGILQPHRKERWR